MIHVQRSELPPEKVRKIRDWLSREESGWLENCVTSQIAVLQAEATNKALDEPTRTIGDERALPADSIQMIKEAALLQNFLDMLKEMRKEGQIFQTVKLTTFET